MKRVCILAALILGLHTATVAGTDREPEHPAAIEARATAMTRAIAEKIHLDEDQYLKLRRMNVRMLLASGSARTRFATSPTMLDEHLAAIQANYQSELLELLRPAQLVAYEQLQHNRTALYKAAE